MLDLHYVAGFFDGEGCVYFRHQTRKLTIAVTVANTNPDVLIRLHEDHGGGLSRRNRATERHKEVWVWTAQGGRAVDFLKTIFEYLIVKKPIANLAIKAFEAREGLSKEDYEIIVSQSHLLNRRGPGVE